MRFKIEGSWILKKAFLLENAKYIKNSKAFDIEAGIYPLGFHIDGKEIICYYDATPTCSTDIIYCLSVAWNEASNFLKQMYESIHINENKESKPKEEMGKVAGYTKGQWLYTYENNCRIVFKLNENNYSGNEIYYFSELYIINRVN